MIIARTDARAVEGIDAAIARVLAHGAFIMGPEVAEVERHGRDFVWG